MKTVLAFGTHNDPQAWELVDLLREDFPKIDFRKSKSPDDILEVNTDLIIIDIVKGIKRPTKLKVDDLKKRKLFTLHDFDLCFYLKLLKEIGKIAELKIIGIPEKDFDIEEVKRFLK